MPGFMQSIVQAGLKSFLIIFMGPCYSLSNATKRDTPLPQVGVKPLV